VRTLEAAADPGPARQARTPRSGSRMRSERIMGNLLVEVFAVAGIS
jgi:hypothetical protein